MSNKNNNQNDNKNSNGFFDKNPIVVFVVFSIVTIMAFKSFFPSDDMNVNGGSTSYAQTISKNVAYSDIKQLINNGQIEYIGIGETNIKAVSKPQNGIVTTYKARKVGVDNTLIPLLESKGINYGGVNEQNLLADMLFGWVLPLFFFFAIWMFLAKRMSKSMGGGGAGGILGMGGAKKMINSEKPNVKFADMAGNKEAKEEVSEIVEFLRNPDKYINLGAQIPKGVLLVGPPGTGKTLLAKAVAGEADVEFLSVTGSSFIEMFVGVGASRVRDLFEQAKKNAPAIIFIDEIDAIGKSRASGGMGGNDEREQTLNQLLAEMDGFSGDGAPVIILAATNRPEILDPALLRPGRFDRQVLVDKPDLEGRIEILNVHIKDVKISKEVELREVAVMTAGLAGADLANIINEAALLAGREEASSVNSSHFKEAVERQIAGLEKKSRRISPKERKIVAYHESGHAVIAEVTKGAKKVNKVSIVPRGLAALGYTLNTPEENKYLMQKHELIAEVDTLLGGRAAEEIYIGEVSTGAGNDLERATDIIKSMATIYGMSDLDIAGLMVLQKQQNQFLGGGQTSKDYSDEMAHNLDKHIKDTLDERYNIVLQALRDNSEAMEQMTAELLDLEVISGKRVQEIIIENGGKIYEGEDLHTEDEVEESIEEKIENKEVSDEEK
ncbi:ATP-dependent zinc metalloprotease FtsH [Arcobacteraceae bacterium]|nr:ATP-dependent zinc metalloprotease FtsH [Arcobacteraceae bacterium]